MWIWTAEHPYAASLLLGAAGVGLLVVGWVTWP